MLRPMNEPRLLRFPCDYPIKVVCRASGSVRAELDPILRRHAGESALERVSEKGSREANFLSITYVIEAHSEAQIAALFAELKICAGVLMVL